MTTKNPTMCPTRHAVSSVGSIGEPQVLKKMVMTVNAIIIKVYCHRVKA